MPGKYLCEYAVIRVVPRVEREEFMNVGVILYCRDLKFLSIRYHLDAQRLSTLAPQIDIAELEQRLQAFYRICCGRKDGGPIGKLPLASRFRWLSAARSTVIQVSAIHPCLAADPQQSLDRLFHQMVL